MEGTNLDLQTGLSQATLQPWLPERVLMPARVLANLDLQPYRKGWPADHDALGGRLHPQRFLPLR